MKPANIVLEPDGRVVLTDFGLGQRWALVDGEVARGSGTPLFMSPGMLSGEPATPRSDLYALGVTLRWALTGHAPFQARTLEELKIEAARGPSRLLRAECPTAPEALVAVIDRAMAPEADARYTEAHGMAVALESAIERIEASGVRRRRHVRSIAVAASIGLAAAAALWLLPGRLVWLGDPRTVRFEVSPPPHMTLDPEPDASAVSPDGRVLAFVAIDSERHAPTVAAPARVSGRPRARRHRGRRVSVLVARQPQSGFLRLALPQEDRHRRWRARRFFARPWINAARAGAMA